MNGNCAGGTGAFIEQMASLLNVKIEDMNALAEKSENHYPIASRCGVFAKTDIQNLLARKVEKADILYFGDMTQPGGNDYPVVQMGIVTITVRNHEDTAFALRGILGIL